MDDIISINADAARCAHIPGVNIARMVGIKVVGDGAQVLIPLNAHADRSAVLRGLNVIIDQIVRLKHLQRKRNPAVTKWPADNPDEHLTRLSQAAAQQPLHVIEAQQTADIAARLVAPTLPGLMNASVGRFVHSPTTLHPHL